MWNLFSKKPVENVKVENKEEKPSELTIQIVRLILQDWSGWKIYEDNAIHYPTKVGIGISGDMAFIYTDCCNKARDGNLVKITDNESKKLKKIYTEEFEKAEKTNYDMRYQKTVDRIKDYLKGP